MTVERGGEGVEAEDGGDDEEKPRQDDGDQDDGADDGRGSRNEHAERVVELQRKKKKKVSCPGLREEKAAELTVLSMVSMSLLKRFIWRKGKRVSSSRSKGEKRREEQGEKEEGRKGERECGAHDTALRSRVEPTHR